ncbi:MAG: hypothetical protein BWY83_00164 [bacterium ADurb.Bin478]|nr:MAG: hypothetical protein BWY83_00164 [bacterium ADurb.Bin478]
MQTKDALWSRKKQFAGAVAVDIGGSRNARDLHGSCLISALITPDFFAVGIKSGDALLMRRQDELLCIVMIEVCPQAAAPFYGAGVSSPAYSPGGGIQAEQRAVGIAHSQQPQAIVGGRAQRGGGDEPFFPAGLCLPKFDALSGNAAQTADFAVADDDFLARRRVHIGHQGRGVKV